MINPFDAATDGDRHYIWQRLIVADSEAFAAGDWGQIDVDFDADRFEGLRAMNSGDPRDWRITFADLEAYRDNWLRASKEFREKKFVGRSVLDVIYARCGIERIEISGDRAIAAKKFAGDIDCADGTKITGDRQTLYRLHRIGGRWKIVGFIGFLPLPG